MSAAEARRELEKVLERPEFRVEAIRASMRCLVHGIWSLVPVVGLVFGVTALALAAEIKRNRDGLWNPGARCVQGGVLLAVLGLVLFLVEMGVVASMVLKAVVDGVMAG